MNKVIISHPYSASIQKFFSIEMQGEDFGNNHPYYQTLWSGDTASLRTVALTLFSCFDEVIFSPVDTILPDFQSYMSGDEYFHPDLGLRMPARPAELGIEANGDNYIAWLLDDPEITRLLGAIKDPFARHQILLQVLCDMELALRHGSYVLSSVGRQLLMQRISLLDPQYNAVSKLTLDFSNVLSHYGELILPDFEVTSIDLLHRIKTDGNVRKYGKSFVKMLKGINPNTSKAEFAELILKTNLKNSKSQNVNKYTGVTAQVISGLSLVADLTTTGGLVSGISAIALGETEKFTNLMNTNWVELKPYMITVRDNYNLEEFIKSQAN
ncbi:hypothetical protein LA064_004596 [Vibrio alginolyticus]|nr:hypothetical protein [Vibrio alginolyticus]